MARTINEISQEIKEAFVADEVIREIYDLQPGLPFDGQFSKVSIEARLIYVFASGVWLMEQLWGVFRFDVEKKVDESYVTSLSWYYRKALEFQKGDSLVFNDKTYSFGYPQPL